MFTLSLKPLKVRFWGCSYVKDGKKLTYKRVLTLQVFLSGEGPYKALQFM